MQLETIRRDVASSGMMQVAKATIKATPKIFSMFEDGTYANKPLAIMRELVANGIDAHVAAGTPDVPVEVQLPTTLDPTCRIRDFGIGMSHDFVTGPFMAYTDGSTKDKSDDQIGGFGIGSKSPFAYVDQYTLRVVHDGVLSVYSMFKDEDGIPSVGLIAQTTTDEANGVEVSFPVEDADMDTFTTAAQDALQYFDPLPSVIGGEIKAPDYNYRGAGWALRAKAGPLGIIMGGVRYPVTTANLSSSLQYNSRLKPLLEYGLDLTLPINSCGVAMSREQLSYVGKTSDNIQKALEAVIDDVISTFANYFDHAASEWDAMALLAKEVGTDQYGRTSARAQLMVSNSKYKGAKLETSFRVTPEDFTRTGLKPFEVTGWRIDPARNRRTTNCPSSSWKAMVDLFGITPGNVETIIIDDLPQSPKSKTIARIREFVSDQPQAGETIVLRGADEHQTAALLQLFRSPSAYRLTSSLPAPAAKAKPIKGVRPRVRMFTFNGQTDQFTHRQINNLTPASSKSKAVAEVPYPSQPDSGIMVVMSSFDLPIDFHRKMDTKLVGFSELVFINQADEHKLKDTFENFNDVFNARLATALAQYPELPARIALSGNPVMRRYNDDFKLLHPMTLTKAAEQRPFGRLYAAWRDYVRPLDLDQQLLSVFVTAKLPAGIDPKALNQRLTETQGDIRILLDVLDMEEEAHRNLLIKNL